MKNKRKILVMEIALLVLEIFAIGFILKQSMEIIPSAAAQEIPQINQEQNRFDLFRSEFPSLSDNEIRALMAQYNTPQEASAALNSLSNEANNAISTGQVSESLLNLMRFFNSIVPPLPQFGGFNSQNFVDSSGGVKVCLRDENNATCQNYLGNECDANCPGGCLVQDISKFPLPNDSPCALGTCYDAKEGTCAGGADGGGSPRANCEELGGKWFAKGDSDADILCRKGCCALSGEARFTTEGECNKLINSTGLQIGDAGVGFDSSIDNEVVCLNSVAKEKEGACTIASAYGNNECKLTGENECRELGGEFRADYLCSNPTLNTTCVKQNYTSCVEGKDEVYWFDSCGNRENIFDSDKDRSWNNGMFLPKEQSCVLGDATNAVRNYATCGNCNRLAGSYCGNKTAAQEIPRQEVVCRDMGCNVPTIIPGVTQRRENGESWCAYDSSTGLPGPDLPGIDSFAVFLPQNPLSSLIGGSHGTDTPGSRNFRMVCQNGEVITSPCADFRNEICVEQRTPKNIDPKSIDLNLFSQNPTQFFQGLNNAAFSGTFSQASCRVNRWQECLAYNPNQMQGRLIGLAGDKANLVLKAYLTATCGKDPDCFIEEIKVADKFEFSYCLPRYNPGFDSRENSQAAQQLCSQASQSCTAVFVKKDKALGFGGAYWECEANCDCIEGSKQQDPKDAKPSQKFVKEMNDFCISLGDCGYHANYVGNLPGGTGFSVRATDCDIDDKDCGKGISDQISASLPFLDGNFASLIPGVGGLLSGADPHLQDAIPFPGEYIQSNNFALNSAGNGQQNLLGGLGELAPSLNNFFSRFTQNGNSVPHVGDRYDTGTGYALAGVSGATGASLLAVNAAIHSGTAATAAGLGGQISYTVDFTSIFGTGGLPQDLAPFTFEGTTYNLAQGAQSITVQGSNTADVISGEVSNQLNSVTTPSITTNTPASTATAGAPSLAGFAGATLGAAAGAAIATVLIDLLGLAPGLSPVTAITVTSLAGAGGAIIGYQLATGGWAAVTPIGVILVTAAVVWISILKILGVGERRKVVVSFTCKAWEAPLAGNCESCGSDGLSDGTNKFPCSRYSCESLGQNCKFVQESEESGRGGLCISSSASDVSAPKLIEVKNDVLQEKFKYNDFKYNEGFSVVKQNGECLNQFERVTFGFKLDEYATCKISAVPPSSLIASRVSQQSENSQTNTNQVRTDSPAFSAMSEIQGDSNLAKEHVISFSSRDLQSLGYAENIGERNEITLYVACQDYLHNENSLNPFKINLCVSKADLTPVQFLDTSGLSELLGFNVSSTQISVRINEAAQCKWDSQDVAYEQMRNEFRGECVQDESRNYVCTADDLPVKPGENKICVKCKDQPNLPSGGNANSDCFWVTLKKSSSELKVVSLSPGDKSTIMRAMNPAEIEMRAETSGGIFEGEANCFYSVDDGTSSLFATTGAKVHVQTLTQMNEGTHTIKVKCNDAAGNEAEQLSTFKIEIDNSPPKIISSRITGTPPLNLRIQTDEKAACAFTNGVVGSGNGPCDFKVGDAGVIAGVNLINADSEGKVHNLAMTNGQNYYLKCRDELGNEPLGCSLNKTINVNVWS